MFTGRTLKIVVCGAILTGLTVQVASSDEWKCVAKSTHGATTYGSAPDKAEAQGLALGNCEGRQLGQCGIVSCNVVPGSSNVSGAQPTVHTCVAKQKNGIGSARGQDQNLAEARGRALGLCNADYGTGCRIVSCD